MWFLSLFDMKWYRLQRAPAPLCVYLKSARYEHSIFSALVWLAPGAEAKLERASETSPVWCGHKDALHLNKHNPFQEKRDRGSCVNLLILTPLKKKKKIYIYIYIYICVCVCVCVYIYIYIYIYMCMCMCVYIYIYILGMSIFNNFHNRSSFKLTIN